MNKLKFEFDYYDPFLEARVKEGYISIFPYKDRIKVQIFIDKEIQEIYTHSIYEALEKANQWYNDYIQLKDILNTTNRKI